MSTVVNRANLDPLYDRDLARYPIEQFWHDPDLSAVIGVDPIYWKESGGVFSEMTPTEKTAKDTLIADAIILADRYQAKKQFDNARVLRAIVESTLDEINILRGQHGLAPRTLSQVLTNIKNKIDSN